MNGDFEKQFGAKFRKQRPKLEWLLKTTADEAAESPLHPGFVALDERSAKIAPAAAELGVAREGEKLLRRRSSSIAGSYLHMHANRLLRSEQRAQELVLYDFLVRLYESEARAKPKKKRASPEVKSEQRVTGAPLALRPSTGETIDPRSR